jgi:dipeptidyl aminopeptidase/acylaminoacyl peptidase
MITRNKPALVVLILLALFGSIARAQEDTVTVPRFAAVRNGTLVLNDTLGEARDVLTAHSYQYLAWNTDGSKLAFLMRDEEYTPHLGVVEADSGEVTLLETPRLADGFNINWTRDGRILFAAALTDPATPLDEGIRMGVFAIAPEADAQPEQLGTFAFGVGCGGGSPFPSDWVYWAETAGFRGFFLTLADTPYGIIHSLNCGGSGLGLLDPATGTSVEIASNLARIVVAPDGSRIAGVELNHDPDRSAARLLVYDLDTLEAVEVATVGEPDLVAWSFDGQQLYYSVRTPDENLAAGLTAEQKARLNEILGYEVDDVPSYMSGIRRVNLETGDDTHLLQHNSYAIGSMFELPDALYFNQVPNLNVWLQMVADGTLNPYEDAGAEYVLAQTLRFAPEESPEAAFLGWFGQFTPVIVR